LLLVLIVNSYILSQSMSLFKWYHWFYSPQPDTSLHWENTHTTYCIVQCK